MKKRLRGINLENDLYIRMGKDKKYVMTRIITDMILEQGKNRYFIVLLRNQNVIPEIDPLTDLYGQVKFEKDIVDYIQQGRKVAVLEIEIDHMNDINILYGTNYSDRIQKVLAYRFIYMMDADKAVYRMGNSNYAFILRDASREEAAAFLERFLMYFGRSRWTNGTRSAMSSPYWMRDWRKIFHSRQTICWHRRLPMPEK